jgi:hypothetical protein
MWNESLPRALFQRMAACRPILLALIGNGGVAALLEAAGTIVRQGGQDAIVPQSLQAKQLANAGSDPDGAPGTTFWCVPTGYHIHRLSASRADVLTRLEIPVLSISHQWLQHPVQPAGHPYDRK